MVEPRDWPRSWRAVRTDDGSWTLAHPEHGATCHSTAGAWQQARERYAGACGLHELARTQDEVALLDIGTGLGLNLAAACAALAGSGAKLRAVSFERDTRVLRAAVALRDWPVEVEQHYAPVRAALEASLAAGAGPRTVELGDRGTLTLFLGDALELLTALDASPVFDAVFLDPFAPSVEPALWSTAFAAELARRMRPHAILSTYSASLRVRRALAQTGLTVGRGPRVGAKSSGTLASFAAELPRLDPRTERRLARGPTGRDEAKSWSSARPTPSIA